MEIIKATLEANGETVTRLVNQEMVLLDEGSASLNLTQADIDSFTRVGQNLILLLSDGRTIRLTGFFNSEDERQLFISDSGTLTLIDFSFDEDGAIESFDLIPQTVSDDQVALVLSLIHI